jgi:hypothetical protein
MFGRKTDLEKATRRDAKRQAVELMIRNACTFPLAVDGSARIPNGLVWKVAVPVKEFWDKLDQARKTALRTGKGCTKTPANAEYHKTTFAEFIQYGGENGEQKNKADASFVPCWGGYVHDGYLWALQVVKESPNSFPKLKVSDYEKMVRDARDEVDAEGKRIMEAYRANPLSRKPDTAEEANYYAAAIAGKIFKSNAGNTYEKAGAGEFVLKWHSKDAPEQGNGEWQKELNKVEEEVRKALLQSANDTYEMATIRWIKWYAERTVPLDEYPF